MTFIVPDDRAGIDVAAAFSMPDSMTEMARQGLRMQAEMANAMFDAWLKPFSFFAFSDVGTPAAAATAPAPVAAPAPAPAEAPAPAVTAAAPIAPAAPVVLSAPPTAPAGEDMGEEAGAPELFAAPKGEPDDLLVIRGIGPKLAKTLNEVGVWHFRQIAAWTPGEVAWINRRIGFGGRVQREDWQAQAARLMQTA